MMVVGIPSAKRNRANALNTSSEGGDPSAPVYFRNRKPTLPWDRCGASGKTPTLTTLSMCTGKFPVRDTLQHRFPSHWGCPVLPDETD